MINKLKKIIFVLFGTFFTVSNGSCTKKYKSKLEDIPKMSSKVDELENTLKTIKEGVTEEYLTENYYTKPEIKSKLEHIVKHNKGNVKLKIKGDSDKEDKEVELVQKSPQMFYEIDETSINEAIKNMKETDVLNINGAKFGDKELVEIITEFLSKEENSFVDDAVKSQLADLLTRYASEPGKNSTLDNVINDLVDKKIDEKIKELLGDLTKEGTHALNLHSEAKIDRNGKTTFSTDGNLLTEFKETKKKITDKVKQLDREQKILEFMIAADNYIDAEMNIAESKKAKRELLQHNANKEFIGGFYKLTDLKIKGSTPTSDDLFDNSNTDKEGFNAKILDQLTGIKDFIRTDDCVGKVFYYDDNTESDRGIYKITRKLTDSKAATVKKLMESTGQYSGPDIDFSAAS